MHRKWLKTTQSGLFLTHPMVRSCTYPAVVNFTQQNGLVHFNPAGELKHSTQLWVKLTQSPGFN